MNPAKRKKLYRLKLQEEKSSQSVVVVQPEVKVLTVKVEEKKVELPPVEVKVETKEEVKEEKKVEPLVEATATVQGEMISVLEQVPVTTFDTKKKKKV
jgi:hypothetical protein